MERQITIKYNWWNADKTEIPQEHQSQLEEHAKERITDMMKEGCTSGELHDEVRDENEKETEYQGWFEINEEAL